MFAMSEQSKVDTWITAVIVLTLMMFAGAICVLVYLSSDASLAMIVRRNAEASTAISASVAIVVAVMAFMITVKMQSPEYRRELEVIDDLVRMRNLFHWLAIRVAGSAGSIPKLDNEEFKLLLDIYTGSAGHFLMKLAVTKSKESGEKPERWRALALCSTNVARNRYNLVEAKDEIIEILEIISEITKDDLRATCKNMMKGEIFRDGWLEMVENDSLLKALHQNAHELDQQNYVTPNVKAEAQAWGKDGRHQETLALARRLVNENLATQLEDIYKSAATEGNSGAWQEYRAAAEALRDRERSGDTDSSTG